MELHAPTHRLLVVLVLPREILACFVFFYFCTGTMERDAVVHFPSASRISKAFSNLCEMTGTCRNIRGSQKHEKCGEGKKRERERERGRRERNFS